ncbi:CCR4-NOT transcription complex subunit 8 isoform X2 [Stegostoma tigrinum]|uniref:CCR4-NOT transcription complex subunit 8 isoform X2 n=1 Tax=Stegostoma tigrinum TaxID=3053191 RepID=UPI00202AEBBE|nr:CCR4-NOT transcription complex subunit 8 isoform X2 [Stegostoma tigrinum]
MPAAEEDHSQIIREVWANNLEEEMRKIRLIIQKYNYIAMDTEFPGVVVRPIGEFRSTVDYQYQLLRCNVDLLKIIQLGLTFMNEKNQYPPGTSTWQFNFKFNLTGYDFGYLIKLLTHSRLPEEEQEFFDILHLFFPAIYDVKYLMKSCKNLKGGLQEVAEQLELERIGRQHQAGSDSLLTGMAFFRMRELFFEDNIDDTKYCGHLYGLGSGLTNNHNGTAGTSEEETNNKQH